MMAAVLSFLKRLIPGWRRRAWARIEREERARARLLGIRSEFDRGTFDSLRPPNRSNAAPDAAPATRAKSEI